MFQGVFDRWRRKKNVSIPRTLSAPIPERASAAAVTAVLGLMRERSRTAEDAPAEAGPIKGIVIRRAPGGWCLHAALGGRTWYCGADRRWVFDLADIGNPFRTFAGVEWYLQEWKVG